MASANLIYDKCAYSQKIQTSTDPLKYQLYYGKFDNSGRCNKQQQYNGQYESCQQQCYTNSSLLRVDVESDLKGIDRLNSQCVTFKYHPNCTNSKTCVKKNDPRVPSSSPPFLCEIRPTNESVAKNKGFILNKQTC